MGAKHSARSYQAELLDEEHIPTQDLHQNLRELNVINTWLGGHAITLAGLKHLLANTPHSGVITIADIGCGGGDNLSFLASWARKQGLSFRFIGIDIKEECIRFAKENCKDFAEIEFICSDYREIHKPFDIVFSALFCHHLNDQQMVHYLDWSRKHSRIGFFVNDLHRHPLAYTSIKWLTRAFSRSYLVRNDAPLSVKRGFHRSELENYCANAGIHPSSIVWKWAFRYLLSYRHAA